MRKVNIRGKEFSVTENQDRFWNEVESGIWETETFDVLDQFIEKDKFFIDIGAWNGVCSIYAARLGATTVSIEPDNMIFPELDFNLRNNICAPAFSVAISDFNGFTNINSIGSFGDSMSSLLNRSDKEQARSVECITLETLIDRVHIGNVSLIKMDIEGGEVLVLKQAKDFLALHKPTIYISLHPAWFPYPKEDLQMIVDVIFPIYRVCRMVNGVVTQYTRDNFLKAIERGEHSYILIAK